MSTTKTFVSGAILALLCACGGNSSEFGGLAGSAKDDKSKDGHPKAVAKAPPAGDQQVASTKGDVAGVNAGPDAGKETGEAKGPGTKVTPATDGAAKGAISCVRITSEAPAESHVHVLMPNAGNMPVDANTTTVVALPTPVVATTTVVFALATAAVPMAVPTMPPEMDMPQGGVCEATDEFQCDVTGQDAAASQGGFEWAAESSQTDAPFEVAVEDPNAPRATIKISGECEGRDAFERTIKVRFNHQDDESSDLSGALVSMPVPVVAAGTPYPVPTMVTVMLPPGVMPTGMPAGMPTAFPTFIATPFPTPMPTATPTPLITPLPTPSPTPTATAVSQ